MRPSGDISVSTNFEVAKKGMLDARGLASSYNDLLAYTNEQYIAKGYPVSVYDDDEDLRGIYICIDENLSDNPVDNAAKWQKVKGAPSGGTSLSGSEADYLVMEVSAGNYAAVPGRSTLPRVTGAGAHGIIQRCIDELSKGNGGHIHLSSGTYVLEDELVIRGWNTANPPVGMIQLTGNGHATLLQQDTADKNAIVCKNKVSVTLRDMRITCGPQALSCLLLDDNLVRDALGNQIAGADFIAGQDPVSVWGGLIDNLTCVALSHTHAAVIIRNTFDVVYPRLECFNINNDGIRIESTRNAGDIIYGNSHFGFLRTYASAAHSGLRMEGFELYRPVDMTTFSNYQCIHALNGIYMNGVAACAFHFVDLEEMMYPIVLDGTAIRQNLGNSFLAGYLLPKGVGSRAISVSEFSGGNTFNFYVQIDKPNRDHTYILRDDSAFRGSNSYDLKLSNGADTSKVIIAHTDNTDVTLRTGDFVIRNLPYLTKENADVRYAQVDGTGAKNTWNIDISGTAQKIGGLRADFVDFSTQLDLCIGFEESKTSGELVMKYYELETVKKFLGITPDTKLITSIPEAFDMSKLHEPTKIADAYHTFVYYNDGRSSNIIQALPTGANLWGREFTFKSYLTPGNTVTIQGAVIDNNAVPNIVLQPYDSVTLRNHDVGNYLITGLYRHS